MNIQDDEEIRNRTRQIFSNWSAMTAEKNDHLYHADDKTVLFDIGTMIDIGWSTQKARLKEAFATLKKFQIVPNNDICVWSYGDFAWATCTWWADGQPNKGSAFNLKGRGTFVFVKKNGQWLAVHDHMSVPTSA